VERTRAVGAGRWQRPCRVGDEQSAQDAVFAECVREGRERGRELIDRILGALGRTVDGERSMRCAVDPRGGLRIAGVPQHVGTRRA
jgi:hypothetical protein